MAPAGFGGGSNFEGLKHVLGSSLEVSDCYLLFYFVDVMALVLGAVFFFLISLWRRLRGSELTLLFVPAGRTAVPKCQEESWHPVDVGEIVGYNLVLPGLQQRVSGASLEEAAARLPTPGTSGACSPA